MLVVAPLRLRRRGSELRLVLQGAAAPPPKPNPLLVRRLIEARTHVADYLDPAQGLSLYLLLASCWRWEEAVDGREPLSEFGSRARR